MSTDRPTPLLASMRDTARDLGISERTLYALVRSGDIRAVRIGSRVLFDRSDVTGFIARAKGVTP